MTSSGTAAANCVPADNEDIDAVALPGPIRLGGFDVEVTIAKRRTARLTVERDARIVVVVPPDTSVRLLDKLVKSRAMWIHTQLAERREEAAARPAKNFVTGEGFLFLGRSHRLKLVDGKGVQVELSDGWLRLRRDRLDSANDDLVGWYRQKGQEWLPGRAGPWATRMGVTCDAINVRRLGYRWGSCSHDGSINIHWATMQLPIRLVDYVLVHELAHLQVRDHSTEFWQVVRRPLPDFVQRRSELDAFGAKLWLP